MQNLTDIQKMVLKLTSNALFNVAIKYDYDIDWAQLRKESYDQAVFLLVYHSINNQIPASEKNEWADLAEKITAKNMTVDYEHTELHDLMCSNSIPYAIIKGSSAASYYPDPLIRMMGDVDFIVRTDDMEKVGTILESVDFVRTDDHDHESHVAYHRGEISTWEMHFTIGGIPDGKYGELIKCFLSDLIDQSVLYKRNDIVFIMPSVFHHGLVMLLHTALHVTGTGIGLRHLCDWAVFVNSLTDDEFVDLFENKLKSIGLWHFACILTALSEKYLGIRHCDWLSWDNLPDEIVLNKLIIDIFEGGNFGKKDIQRLNQSKLITDSKIRQVGTVGMFHQLVRSYNSKALIKMPIAKKIPILLPIAWIKTLFWYLGLIVRGKRPTIDIRQTVANANSRREIYKEFRLFE